jgi:hypothetical protein
MGELQVSGAAKEIGPLLTQVHKRLGLGVDIQTFADGKIEISWRRNYEGAWSDLRSTNADDLASALRHLAG